MRGRLPSSHRAHVSVQRHDSSEHTHSWRWRAAVAVALAMLAGTPAGAAAQAGPADTPGSSPAGGTYLGTGRQTDVSPPRLDEPVTIDGALDEPAWQRAALLTGFSKYSPVDGAPAERRTDVLVWYSPTALHVGVRAEAAPAEVRATLADRDRLDTDDRVLVFLDTFNDSRQATVFIVNPLGAQADGALVEGTRGDQRGFAGLASGREAPDLSPDFVFQSRGRLTATGYEVEIRIPFKSLRYQAADPQDWGFNVTRVTAGDGREDSWAPARRDGASFLAQSGRLRGLTGLRRGLVLDLNPVVTSRVDGARAAGGWRYDASRPEAGLNVRWGVTANLTLNGTLNPDFSQVEADAGQVQYDPRQALFFAEKRPFFLDGIEQFSTPNNLVYTRRIVAPDFAAKLTGKIGAATSVAVLSAVDDESLSRSGRDHPIFTIARVQHDIGGQSKVGLVYTDRVAGDDSNRVFGADSRVVFREIYSLQAQAAVSRTATPGEGATAPLWQVTASRNGRRFGFRYVLRGVDERFRAASGFISRAGVANVTFTNQALFYGGEGSRLERVTSDIVVDGVWKYGDFTAGRGAQDRKLHWNNNLTLRGGWQFGGSVLVETFGYDADLYADYALADRSGGDTVLRPFVGTPRLPNFDFVASVTTPQRRGLGLDVFAIWGKDENFFEWASADILFGRATLLWRPTERLRVDAQYQVQTYQRRSDGSYVGTRHLPRVKVEYQVRRAIFLRLVGEHDAAFRDALRDDSRTNLPIVIRGPGGDYAPALRERTERFRLDALFSYQPTPGTVVFLGYGSTMREPNERREPGLRRVQDGFFVKVSYLFRL